MITDEAPKDNAQSYAQDAAKSAEEARQAAGCDGTAASISAVDVQGLVAAAGGNSDVQALINAVADRVINRLVAKGQIVNNLLATEPGNVLDATQGKALKEYYDRLNSDLGNIATNLSNVSTGLAATNIDLDPLKSNRVSHINSNVLNKVNIVLWDADTADTPFKAGNTNRGNGFCITYSSGEPYSCQLAMAVGDSHVFTRNSGPDGWSGWTTK